MGPKTEPGDAAGPIQALLGRLAAGDRAARNELIAAAGDRLTRLARKMLRDFPGVGRWEQTDDVHQNASLRLCQALAEVSPATPDGFFRLAATVIRRELIDLARKHSGPHGLGANHASVGPGDAEATGPARFEAADETHAPDRLAAWTEFHTRVEDLPPREREVFELVYYQGLMQAEAAALLGVDERTVKRRWQAARIHLHDAMRGVIPER